jgi:serine/threonine protein kinase
MNPAPGTLVARRFQLVRELGRGSMGTVWLADHTTLALRCAVKFMTTEAERDPDYRERFEREARAVAQLDCPNVVRVLDYDVFEGVPFLAMEWLSGDSLETRLHREGRLQASDVHRIVAQVAQGLACAHAAGIIHRDLKPGNVFLANGRDGEVAKILDFGLAKIVSYDGAKAMTLAGSILGTPVYMSPEQARGLCDVDHRADLWSLAVIAYECLLGELPFDGPSLGEVFARVMFEPIPVPSSIDPHVPPAFDRWWARAVCRDVEGRFASAPEMAEALGQALGLDDGHASRADRAVVSTVRPPPRRRSRWPGATAAAAFIAIGARFVPNVPHVALPASVDSSVRSAMDAIARSASHLAGYAEAAAPAVAPSAGALRSSPPSPSSGSSPAASAVSLAIPPDATPTPTILAPPPPATLLSGRSPSPPGPRAAVQEPSVGEPPAIDPEASGAECRAGQRRCNGRVLQLCNEERDGWADVIECGPGAVCDATGAGGCSPLGAEGPGGGPSESASEEPSPSSP